MLAPQPADRHTPPDMNHFGAFLFLQHLTYLSGIVEAMRTWLVYVEAETYSYQRASGTYNPFCFQVESLKTLPL